MRSAVDREWRLPLILLFASVVAANIGLHLSKSTFVVIPLTLATALSIAGWRVRYQDISPALGIVIRGICATIVIHLLLAYPFFLGEEYDQQPRWFRIAVVSYFLYGAVLFGIGGLFRPTLALLPCIFLIVLKRTIGRTSGLGVISTDYAIIPEMGLFAISGILVYQLYIVISSKRAWPSIYTDKIRFSDFVFFGIVSVHFGNYFYAGIEKIFLYGPWFSWVWNETPNLLLNSIVQRTNPLAAWPTLLELSYEGFTKFYVISNITVLFAQLVCIFALARRESLIVFTIFFDVMHIAIFLASGIFFWNWILLNVFLVAGLTQLTFKQTRMPLLIFGVGLLLASPRLFSVEMLGWYDAREINLDRVVAILDDGQQVDLPASFFRNHSVTFAQNWADVSPAPRIPVGAAGGTDYYDQYRLSYTCGIDLIAPEPGEAVGPRFFRGYFKHIRPLLDEKGRLSFNLVPHHIWTNPALFKEASNLDVRRIVAVEHFREVVCVEPGSTPSAMRTRTVSSVGKRYPVELAQ